MPDTKLTRRQFFLLHEKTVEKADNSLRKIGGLTKSKDSFFYGYGTGSNCETSINFVVKSFLDKNKYDFEGFSHKTTDDGDFIPKFNGEKLYRLKTNFNKVNKKGKPYHKEILISTHYLNAYLFYLNFESVEDLESTYENEAVKEVINHTQSVKIKNPKSDSRKKTGSFQFRRTIPIDYEEAVRRNLEDTSWILYTYNFDHKRIVQANLEIGSLGDNENFVKLINPESAYNYIGYVNCRLAYHRIIQFDLITEAAYAKQINSMFYINFLRPAPKLILGQQLSFGHHHEINSSNAILLNGEDYIPEPDYLEPGESNLHSAIEKFLNPHKVAYRIIPRHTFKDLDDFDNWLDKPGLGQPPHFPRD